MKEIKDELEDSKITIMKEQSLMIEEKAVIKSKYNEQENKIDMLKMKKYHLINQEKFYESEKRSG